MSKFWPAACRVSLGAVNGQSYITRIGLIQSSLMKLDGTGWLVLNSTWLQSRHSL